MVFKIHENVILKFHGQRYAGVVVGYTGEASDPDGYQVEARQYETKDPKSGKSVWAAKAKETYKCGLNDVEANPSAPHATFT